MQSYVGEPDFEHGEIPALGILVANLGTPANPTTPAVRRYLRQFLSDPRVIEVPAWKWQIILNLFVLPTRPRKSAELYEVVWTDEGSPLLIVSRKQARGLEDRLRKRFGNPIHVALGMRYGEPSIESAIDELTRKGCRRLLHFPLYPQYSATTTASTFDAVADALKKRRWIPELRTINGYVDSPGYIEALASSVREVWEKDGEPRRLLMSFHGLPVRYFHAGDPYHCQCQKTGRLLGSALGLDQDRYQVTFQSRFGKEPWLEPYTDRTLKAWGAEKLESVDVICPGFSADCLETIEEIDKRNRGFFTEAGGGRFRYLPALNDRGDHLEALVDVACQHVQGWAVPRAEYDAEAAKSAAEASRKRAGDMGCPARS